MSRGFAKPRQIGKLMSSLATVRMSEVLTTCILRRHDVTEGRELAIAVGDVAAVTLLT